jgi:hypothetical protein
MQPGCTVRNPRYVGNRRGHRRRLDRREQQIWQADRVDPWNIGLVAVIVVGLAMIILGALTDRYRNKRRATAMLAPPAKSIPRFHPDAPAPHYLSDLQARRAPEGAEQTELTQPERELIASELNDPETVTINAGYASGAFVTDQTSSWAVLESPAVMVCADAIESFRELLGVLEKLILAKTPLVVAAPAIAPEVLATLEVNKIRQTMRLLVVTPDEAGLDAVAKSCRATAVDRRDRQAGDVPEDRLGGCERWVSTAKASYVIGTPDVQQSG